MPWNCFSIARYLYETCFYNSLLEVYLSRMISLYAEFVHMLRRSLIFFHETRGHENELCQFGPHSIWLITAIVHPIIVSELFPFTNLEVCGYDNVHKFLVLKGRSDAVQVDNFHACGGTNWPPMANPFNKSTRRRSSANRPAKAPGDSRC